MISKIVAWCAHHYVIVVVTTLLLALAGELARRQLTGDVIPDLADPQIGLVADWMGHPAPAVASEITKVITHALAGVPGTKAIRGLSMSNMAYVNVVFASTDGLDDARKVIIERLKVVRPKLPNTVRLYIGPTVSTTGWVFEYALSDPALVSSLIELRRFQDEVLRPALSTLPGVAEVASVGGELQEVRIDVKARELRDRGLAFSDIFDTLRSRFATDRSVSKLSLAEIEALPVRGTSNPIRLGDLALVRLSNDEPAGIADVAGAQAVGGIVVARRDANIAALVAQAKAVIARECRKLPHRAADPKREDSGAAAEVHVATTYDRAELATRVQHTLLRALAEEVVVVAFVILIFLLHGRSALVPLVTLPVVLLLTFGSMWLLQVPATLMSFGGIGIALGLAVDADIVALEASHRQLETLSPDASASERRARIVAAAQSFAPAILTALVITAISFLPVFAFPGETGRLLRPLALTKTLVIVSAALVTLTLAPALRHWLLRGRVIPEFNNPITRGLVSLYRPFVHFALRRPTLTLMTAGLALISCLPILSRLGAEFLPRVEEGDLFYMPTTLPGVPSDAATQQLRWQDNALSRFGEVATVFGKIGHAETGTDPAPYSMVETTIRLRPQSEWPKVPRHRWYSSWATGPVRQVLRWVWPEQTRRSSAELIDALDKAVRLPGWTAAWTSPARARMDMMTTGVRVPVGIRIIASNPQRLDSIGTTLRALVEKLPGTRSAVFESLGGENWIDFDVDESALARHHLEGVAAERLIELMTTGGQVGEVEQRDKLLRVRLAPDIPDVSARGETDILRDITLRSIEVSPSDNPRSQSEPVAAWESQPIPFALLGKPKYVRRPASLRVEKVNCAHTSMSMLLTVRTSRATSVAHDRRLTGRLARAWSTSIGVNVSNGRANTIC